MRLVSKIMIGLGVSLLAVILIIALCICQGVPVPLGDWWGWILVILPASMIIRQWIYVWMVRRPSVQWDIAGSQRQQRPVQGRPRDPRLKVPGDLGVVKQHISKQSQLYFDPLGISMQYGILLALHILVSLALFHVCYRPPFRSGGIEEVHPGVLAAIRLGAAGAFVYVLIYLGRRTFQCDITSGAAVWSAVQLALGPVLAGTLAYFLEAPKEPPPGVERINYTAIYFLAGLSPRLIADWISGAVERLWMSPGGAPATSRLIPLSQVRGITRNIESRLSEEGIEDAAVLAMANPVKLLRNTPFDPRQVLSWIDEAMLILTMPQHWQTLENEGITGAIDLAWYALDDDDDDDGLGRLAKRINIDPHTLRDIADRLVCDDQVEMIWAMYEANGDSIS